MRVLQVIENYSAGGLERFVAVLTKELLDSDSDWNFVFALGSYNNQDLESIGLSSIIAGFGFADNYEQTVGSFLDDVDKLCEIIRNNEIDLVIAHPFYSVFPAVAAAKTTGVPVAYVAHGPGSMTFAWTAATGALLQYCVDYSLDHIFAVREGLVHPQSQNGPSFSLVHNPVKLPHHFENEKHMASKRWALATRIDEDKIKGICHLIDWLPYLNIDGLDVFGNGSEMETLTSLVIERELDDKVVFHGFREDWLDLAQELDFGVIGLSRVAIEALAAGFPTILLPLDDNPCGLVTSENINSLMKGNFAAYGIPRLKSADELNYQLKSAYAKNNDYTFADQVQKCFCSEKVAETFSKDLSSVVFHPDTSWTLFVDSLRKHNDQSEALFKSDAICQMMQQSFGLWAISPFSHWGFVNSAEIARTRSDIRLEILGIRMEQIALKQQYADLENGMMAKEKSSQQEIRKLKSEIARLKTSSSWKIGRAITKPARTIKRILK